jgi:GTP cyclohydrolase I
MKLKLIEQGVRLMLQGFEVDPADANYKDTPRRVARLYRELFTPPPNNMAVFPEHHENLILLRGHDVVGVCPHHLLPVRFKVYLGYIPNDKVLGLSKLGRIIHDQLTGPVLQERFTERIADAMQAAVRPRGIAVIVSAAHGCMQLRGLQTHADVVTSTMRGVFLLNPPAREELLRLIGRVE